MLEGAEVRLAVDIGGTFTDIVLDVGQHRRTRKLLTTPTRPEQAVLDGMRLILTDARAHICDIDVFIHGTTLATNAIIERRGARTALVATEGFRDVLDIGTESRYDQYDLSIDKVTFVHGDVWNVNPIALKRVERLFCKNERAVLRAKLTTGEALTLVPVAAILVASIRLPFLDGVRDLRRLAHVPEKLKPVFRPGHAPLKGIDSTSYSDGTARAIGRNVIACSADFAKGAEVGWFQHGSTIVLFAPDGFTLCDQVKEGTVIRMGQPLMRLP